MRLLYFVRRLLVVSLLTSLFATAFRLDFLPRDLSNRIFGRSLPGSLATAPQGAIGYPPPPGPIANEAPPTEIPRPKVYTTITTTIITRDVSHELRQAMGNSSISHGPSGNVAIVTGVVTKTQVVVVETQTAGANRHTIWSWVILPLSLLVSFWNL